MVLLHRPPVEKFSADIQRSVGIQPPDRHAIFDCEIRIASGTAQEESANRSLSYLTVPIERTCALNWS
jgi:hypothetical protein